ncbi:PilC/PilY family type IV pilus protein [Stenotrophomonas sp. SY1]|uniref:pilus assembly protein n=1 Tax=Stenotrophomonas sp. SY1 TaxID=477235 RepID=UPI001E4E381B|nr:PilC/PilY family type IV pilus protein [Stenotrophomonas sp. SY1]MCD9086517.1 pilus assembly protein [Stenotrophomonas sp. SY1]
MKRTNIKQKQAGELHRQWWIAPSAFLATLLTTPAHAGIVIPDDPLTTAARVAPNILFILDDSGSMAWRNMNNRDVSAITGASSFESTPDRDGVTNGTSYTSESTENAAMYMQGYATNSLYYNPAVDYLPWMQADGTRVTGGQSFTAAYSDTLDIPHTGAGTSSGTRNLSRYTQTFYVPKDTANSSGTYLSNVANYYRYQILAGGSIYRSEYLGYTAANTPSTAGSQGCSTSKSGSAWRNCQSRTPTGRTEDQEKANFATWYSYHRTRTKAAKAGAAEAFGSLDSKVRVGFRTIWNRKNFDIPVGDGNDGRFVNNVRDLTVPGSKDTTSRSTWFNRLYAAGAQDGTPLQTALDSAGQYFSQTGASGPYGPELGDAQLSCRQNFAILTTDGYWNTSVVDHGNADGSAGSVIKGAQGKTYTYSPAAPFTDGYSKTLADVAMKYWKTDLRTEDSMGNATKPENNNVPTSDANPAFWQHMVTFGISIGLKTTKGWSSLEDVPADPEWPDPGTSRPNTDKAERIDDLLHAAVNGHGQFVAASSPAEFTKGLGAALAAIAQRTGSFSNVATNSTSLNTGSQAFSASYVSGVWTGQVLGQTVTRDGVSGGWTSSVPAFADRNVFTYNSDFPTQEQQTALARDGGPADYPVTGEENANYIKGDSSGEERNGGLLRNRPNTVLGDIVGSSPAYVKETGTLYVGANDGMLHAFDASNGRELFAYVPGIVSLSKLATLSRGDYAHKFLVDGPVVATSRSLTPGKNILVGSLGRGGKGLYALDVTSPSTADADEVSKWELAETPENNMGLVLGRPILSKVQGTAAAVVLGNGINSAGDKAVLLVINANTGAVIREIDTGVGSATAPNGLSAPTGIYGADGKTLAYAYAGDMLGNVWKFDMTDSNPNSWTAKLLFSAKDGNDATTAKAQPISAGVTIAIHPRTNKRWVFFGTGRYLTTGDADSTNTDVQSMYGFIDSDEAIERSELTERVVEITSATESGFTVRAFEAKAALPAGSKGWYIDLPDGGERIVQDAQVVASYLITASMVPTGSACDANGRGYINALDAFTGTSAGGSYFDLDNDQSTSDKTGGLPIGSVDAGVGMPTLPNLMRGVTLLGGSGGTIGTLRTLTPRWDRVSWRELKVN